MANNSQKKTVERNRSRNKINCGIVFATIIFFLVWRFMRGTMTTGAYWSFAICLLFQMIPLYYTYIISRPTIIDGEIIDCGSDLSQEGLLEFVHDIMYFSSFIQFICSFTLFGNYLYIVIIGYCIYLLYSMKNSFGGLLGGNNSQPEVEDDAMGKKKGKKQNKPKFKTVGRK